jgi:hypothetical protein
MTDIVVMDEGFENDCGHTAEVIMSTLVRSERNNAFLLTDVDEALFESSFVRMVARYLGGVVDGDSIHFMGKTIYLSFTTSLVMFGNIENLEVIIEIV